MEATSFKENWIYVIDEGVKVFNAEAERIKKSKNCYFIIITRHNRSLDNINYDLYSVKELVEVQKGKLVLQGVSYDNMNSKKLFGLSKR